ncbi:MAG TPA: cytochrome C oxidase subunit IV family protein [Terriglobales bacterium]|jgi:cytochrome c oxidase subunit IV|nr:cytochrome C oxidase subunit IV family protein [Terriglobales bacterium]
MEKIISAKVYFTVWAALMCLTVTTAAVSYLDLGAFSIVLALIIATVKGSLVVLFFMHAKYINVKATLLVILAGFFWLAILLLMTMSDYITRAWS